MPEQQADAVQPTQQTISQPDTIGMAAFNAWKAQNELASTTAYQAKQTQVIPEKTRTIVKYVPVAKSSTSKPAKTSIPDSNTPSSSSTEQTNAEGSGTSGNTAGTGATETPTVEKKEGWSKAAKGAVIGGVAGAAGGAILNKKNRVAGAVIGGVVGAAGGYGIGRTMDKKDGRIDYSTIMN